MKSLSLIFAPPTLFCYVPPTLISSFLQLGFSMTLEFGSKLDSNQSNKNIKYLESMYELFYFYELCLWHGFPHLFCKWYDHLVPSYILNATKHTDLFFQRSWQEIVFSLSASFPDIWFISSKFHSHSTLFSLLVLTLWFDFLHVQHFPIDFCSIIFATEHLLIHASISLSNYYIWVKILLIWKYFIIVFLF